MLDIKEDIHSLSDFKRRTPEFIKLLEKTRRPVVLTMNGRARIVVQDAASYQEMLDAFETANEIEAIRRGLESIDVGRTVELGKADKELRAKFKFPKAE